MNAWIVLGLVYVGAVGIVLALVSSRKTTTDEPTEVSDDSFGQQYRKWVMAHKVMLARYGHAATFYRLDKSSNRIGSGTINVVAHRA